MKIWSKGCIDVDDLSYFLPLGFAIFASLVIILQLITGRSYSQFFTHITKKNNPKIFLKIQVLWVAFALVSLLLFLGSKPSW